MHLTAQERAVVIGLCVIVWVGLVVQTGLHRDWKAFNWLKGTPAASGIRRISINTATTEELLAVPGIGPKTAQYILEYRSRQPFRSFEPLLQARGMTPERYERLQRYVQL